MAMTLRLDEATHEALRQRAAREGRSMQETVRDAVDEYLMRHAQRDELDRVLDEQLPRYEDALHRLGQ